jgi:hypothetical protein
MKKLLMIATVLSPLLFPAHAAAEISGNDWLVMCSAKRGSAPALACSGYTRGVADGIFAASVANDISKHPELNFICAEANVITQQLIDVGLRAIKSNPETRHHPAAILLSFAWAKAFPCPQPKDQSRLQW